MVARNHAGCPQTGLPFGGAASSTTVGPGCCWVNRIGQSGRCRGRSATAPGEPPVPAQRDSWSPASQRGQGTRRPQRSRSARHRHCYGCSCATRLRRGRLSARCSPRFHCSEFVDQPFDEGHRVEGAERLGPQPVENQRIPADLGLLVYVRGIHSAATVARSSPRSATPPHTDPAVHASGCTPWPLPPIATPAPHPSAGHSHCWGFPRH